MRLSLRVIAASAVIVSAALAGSSATAYEAPCFKTTGEPRTITYPGGSTTINRVPTGVDWSDCVD